MASHPHTSPQGPLPPHHGPPGPPGPVPNGHAPPQSAAQHLGQLGEEIWVRLGLTSEHQNDLDGAISCYESALRHNRFSTQAMLGIANILRGRDQFAPAIDYLRAITKFDDRNGDVYASLGHCCLMLDQLTEAYQAYQQALYHLPDLREPRLWYGIGILYDRYGSLEHAEEAFSQVMRMAPDFEKANEIYFRLGIIYKQQQKYKASLDCFRYIVQDPPKPLTDTDIWFQIGHVHEQQKDYDAAKSAYMRVLDRDPKHAKVLQQLGWLHHQQSNDYNSQEQAISYLEKSVESDQSDSQSWYLLGRCYMAQQKYPSAYEAYQQAVYRDGRNPTFWCSIGVLYYQINQYRDALDAYSRAIRLNPNISEVWYDLGTLYESCNNQTADALDAYQRAAELDSSNVHIKARLDLLREGHHTNGMPNQGAAPLPQDVHPQAYQPAISGPPVQWGARGPAGPNPSGPPPPLDYGSKLADIQPLPPAGAQQLQPYDPRDRPRTQNLPSAPHPGSPPRQEPPRAYAEPPRPPGRRQSPSPKSRHVAPQYPGHGGPPPPPPHLHDAPTSHPPDRIINPNRIANPNYGPPPPSSAPPIPPSHNGPPPPPGQHHLGGYGRITPPNDARAALDQRPNSVGAGHHGAPHYPPGRPGSSLAPNIGGPPPPPSLHGHPEPHREREDQSRTPIPPKRVREWDDDPIKPGPSDEKRPRLDEHLPRIPSVHDRPQHDRPQSRNHHEDHRRPEDLRPAPQPYHPSEAAHHPPLHGPAPPQPQPTPPLSQGPQHSYQPPSSDPRPAPVKESPRDEPAARKMDVDENYDDDEDDKRGPTTATPTKRESPRNERIHADTTAGATNDGAKAEK